MTIGERLSKARQINLWGTTSDKNPTNVMGDLINKKMSGKQAKATVRFKGDTIVEGTIAYKYSNSYFQAERTEAGWTVKIMDKNYQTVDIKDNLTMEEAADLITGDSR